MYDMIARLAELMAELAEEIACPASDQGVHQTQLSRIQDDLQGIVESARAGQADSVRDTCRVQGEDGSLACQREEGR